MKACILAAGRGTRLAATGHLLPKGLLQVEDGGPSLIEQSLDRLKAAGVGPVVVVTGHQAECYQALALRRPEMVCCHNPYFVERGSLTSLVCAAPRLQGQSFLLLESDLLYEPRALTLCLEHPAADVVLLSGPTGSGDEVWVETSEAGDLVAMSKRRADLGPVRGELVGISKISADLFVELQRVAEESPEADYETDGLVRCTARRPIPCHLVEDLIWTEIDDPQHLARARAEIYPRMR